MLQCIAVYCSVLQCAVTSCNILLRAEGHAHARYSWVSSSVTCLHHDQEARLARQSGKGTQRNVRLNETLADILIKHASSLFKAKDGGEREDMYMMILDS